MSLGRWSWSAVLTLLQGAASAACPASARLPDADPLPDHWAVGDADSIPDNNVTALAEDSQGWLWIGTPEGLLRYDGYRFRRYTHDPDNPHALAGNFVRQLLATPDGGLWVGTDHGLSRYLPQQDRFESFRHRPADPRPLPDGINTALLLESNGDLIVGTSSGGVARLEASTKHFEPLVPAASMQASQGVTSLVRDDRQRLWVGTTQGLYWLQERRLLPVPLVDAATARTLAAEGVNDLLLATDGQLWVGGRRGTLLRIAANAMTMTTSVAATGSGSGSAILAIAQSGDVVWIAGQSGLSRYRLEGSRIPADSTAFADSRAILRDRSGAVWLGGFGRGLTRFSAASDAVRVHRISLDAASGPTSIRSILAMPDRYWIGTVGHGLVELDSALRPLSSTQVRVALPPWLRNGHIAALTPMASQALWVSYTDGLAVVDPSTHRFEVFPDAGSTPRDVRCLWADGDDLWIGSNSGLYHANRGTRALQQLVSAEGDAPVRWINALALDSERRLWIGGRDALFVLEPGDARPRHVRAPPGQPTLSSTIVGLLLDRHDRLWIDTGNGLFRLLEYDGRFARFDPVSQRLGIGGTAFGANLLEDSRGRIWTPRYVYDPESDQLYTLTRADGVHFGTSWFRAYAQDAQGRLLFGGSEGLLVIDPERFEPWTYAPPLVVSSLQIDGVERSFAVGDRIALQPQQRSFNVEFAALDYSAPKLLRYRYRLDGYDADWIDTDAGNRFASYGNLPPGDYTLRIRGSNRAGAWSPHELEIPVQVLPAWWQTAWFAALALLALLGCIAAAIRWRTAVVRARAQALERMVAQRTRQLVDAQQQLVTQEKMAALGTLTAGVAHEINNPANFADGAVQNLQQRLHELRVFLHRLAGDDAAPDVLAAIDTRLDELAEMAGTAREGHERIKRIVADLRQFTRLDEAERKRIRLSEPIRSTVNLIRTRFDRIVFELDLAIDPEIECQPAKLGQALMNLIVNACEAVQAHRGERGGWVRIGTAIDGAHAVVSIEDNGGGMDEATRQHIFEPFFTTKGVGEGTGLGLAITLGIVREHGGSISIDSLPGQGSRFRLQLPLATPGVAA